MIGTTDRSQVEKNKEGTGLTFSRMDTVGRFLEMEKL